jgi:alkaline phosphatase
MATPNGRFSLRSGAHAVLFRFRTRLTVLVPATLLAAIATATAEAPRPDPIRDLQTDAIATKDEKKPRVYHFGPQGAGDRYSDSTGHSNRLIPVYTFGRKIDLGSVTGKNSRYRDPEKIKELYGVLPKFTYHPAAEYADQSDLYRVQKEAVERGVKHLFIVWFDGMDWHTSRAAAIAKTGVVYNEGKGTGLNFLDETAEGSAQFGYYVTSPVRSSTSRDVNNQTVTHDPKDGLLGGYDPLIAGFNPWTPGPFAEIAPTYIKGGPTKNVVGGPQEIKPETAELAEEQITRFLRDAAKGSGVKAIGRYQHAVTDSAPSAAELASGVKSYNDSVNVADDGRFVPTLFNQLQQDQGWKVGTVTSVPFNHASPSAMYAHNVDRNDYQDLGREMLGLESIAQTTGKSPRLPGLDVVMGAGNGQKASSRNLKSQGDNAVEGNLYLTDADLKTIDIANGGQYVVAKTTSGVNGAKLLQEAAEKAAADGNRLFGFFGSLHGHLPFRTADGRYDPVKGIGGSAEKYPEEELNENPTLADMTRSALTVLGSKPEQPFALFVEAGDVDFGLHDNNLDNAIGAVHSGELAITVILDWIKTHSNWDESALIVSADHGHYLVVDDPSALAPKDR